MSQCNWTNFFVTSLSATLKEGHIPADQLRASILNHNGVEAYHCLYDLEKREDFKNYDGKTRPALGYVWFDFDSRDGGESAFMDTRQFCSWLDCTSLFIAFSGSKGFHVGLPFSLFNLGENEALQTKLSEIAKRLKERFKTIDTSIYNANRKFRVLGSLHPKTGLYKIALNQDDLKLTLDQIKMKAKERGSLEIPVPPILEPCVKLSAILPTESAPNKDAAISESITLDEWRRYRQPEGTEAFLQCKFLAWSRDNPASVTEPLWYACASIVGRFKDGRQKFQLMSKGHPSYSVTATDEKLEQALQASGPRTCAWIDSQWGGCKDCALRGKIKSPVVILEKDVIPTEASGFYHVITLPDGKQKHVPSYEDLLTAFKRDKKYFIDSMLNQIYAWSGTHYVRISETDINAYCESVMVPKPTQRIVNEFRAKILRNEIRSQDWIEKFFFDTTKGKLNLKNGVLDIATRELSPHNDALGFRYVLPYDYDPAATAPTFVKFINEITLNREGLKRTLLEFMGYCLWPSYDDHCFLWLAGTGRNGKSTFMEILQALVGAENCSNVLISAFEKTNYLQMMDHKLVNIAEESDEAKIPATIMGTLKALSAGAKVQVDQKYEIPYSMRATAKLVFASNKSPFLPGTESAIKARMIVVPFDLELEKYATDNIESKIDWNLIEKIKTELPGILTLCLLNLRNFLKGSPRKIFRSSFSYEATNEIMRDSDPIEAWLQDEIKFDGAADLSELYMSFKSSLLNPEKAMDVHWFARRLRQKLGTKCRMERRKILGKRSTLFEGISLKNDASKDCATHF